MFFSYHYDADDFTFRGIANKFFGCLHWADVGFFLACGLAMTWCVLEIDLTPPMVLNGGSGFAYTRWPHLILAKLGIIAIVKVIQVWFLLWAIRIVWRHYRQTTDNLALRKNDNPNG